MLDFNRLCIHHATVQERWTMPQFIDGMVQHGVGSVAVLRDKLADCGVSEGAKRLEDAGLVVTSLCAGGLVTTPDEAEAVRAMDEFRRAIDEAARIKAGSLMFVTGGVDPRDKNLDTTRKRVLERLAAIAPHARSAGLKIALETLHPMRCGARSLISTLATANDFCDALADEDVFGIAIDTYAVWWDPALAAQIKRAGRRIINFHVADWLHDTCDLRLDRGMPGDGLIDLPGIRHMVEDAGYEGYIEIELFSARDWWKRDPDEVVRIVKERYQTAV
ncbi:sugar phosphate isomerase/epimerase family protein [Nocardioides sp. NPDC004968]|uniref:sugar phosphate isomerase/epimerase family protein n=1 Tax=Nocardioides sp. NPDC004968 TaxID=3155894 RepID=UPI0033B47A35